MTRLYLVRHGETDWNVDNRCQGQMDIPLNVLGRQQARYVAKWFSDKPRPDFIMSSDLFRARTTAEAIASEVGLANVSVDAGWREVNFGVWQGLSLKEIQEQYPELQSQYLKNPGLAMIPEAETQSEALARVKLAFESVIEAKGNTCGIVVSHGSILRLLLADLLGIGVEFSRKIRIFNCSVSEVLVIPGHEPSVITINDHCFLPPKS